MRDQKLWILKKSYENRISSNVIFIEVEVKFGRLNRSVMSDEKCVYHYRGMRVAYVTF